MSSSSRLKKKNYAESQNIFKTKRESIQKMNLLKACSDADVKCVRKICRSAKSKQQLALRDNYNWGPLHIAVERENIEIVNILLQQSNMDIRAESHEGETALMLACCKETVPLEIVALLIAKDPDLVNWVNNELVSPLQFAVNRKRLDIVRLLIKQGNADPNYKDLDGEHALFYAVYALDLPIIIYLMHETKCDMQHRNVNNITAYDLFLQLRRNFTDSDGYFSCMAHMFRITYDDFVAPEDVTQHICSVSTLSADQHTQTLALILETFYLSDRINPDYCKLVGRLLNVDLHLEPSQTIEDQLCLCFPLQSVNVMGLDFATIMDVGTIQHNLSALFRLFVYDRELFNTYLPLIMDILPYCEFFDTACSSVKSLEKVSESPNLCCFMFEFFKTICIFGFNPEKFLSQLVQPTKLIQFLYPLISSPRPFISRSATNDAVVCRHFEETDSGEDVQRYVDFKNRFEQGLRCGYVPTLFCLSRTVVRETVFRACPASDQPYTKLSKLLTLRLPRIIQNRLVYIKSIDYKF